MKHFNIVSLFFFLILLMSGDLRAQKRMLISDSIQIAEIKHELEKSNNKLLDILSNVTKPKSKEDITIFMSFLIALGGWAFGIYQVRLSSIARKEMQKTGIEEAKIARLEQNIFTGLDFFSGGTGGTQRRGVGIAIIKANWSNPELVKYKPTWRAILIGQAVFLLNESTQHKKKHELTNLENIMKILLIDIENIEIGDVATLKEAIEKNKKNKESNSSNGLKIIEDSSYRKWTDVLEKLERSKTDNKLNEQA